MENYQIDNLDRGILEALMANARTAYAELAIAGHGNGNLDLLVSDDKGTIICQDNGSGDSAVCGFTPAENGTFTVTVTKASTTPDGYILLTN